MHIIILNKKKFSELFYKTKNNADTLWLNKHNFCVKYVKKLISKMNIKASLKLVPIITCNKTFASKMLLKEIQSKIGAVFEPATHIDIDRWWF